MSIWRFEITDRLPEKAAGSHVFHHPALIEAWMATYTPLRNLEPLFVLAKSETAEACMPLVLWRRNWKNAFVKAIVPVGFSDFDYHDPIFSGSADENERAAFWTELESFLRGNVGFDELVIDGITDSWACGDTFTQGEICPRLDLAGIKTDDDLMAFFKTSLRGDLRRQMRRLNEIGELTFREYGSFDEIPEKTFGEFMRQHSARWPNAYKAPHFHENLLKYGLSAGVTHFSTLSVGDTEIAWHLGFSHQGVYYYYMPAGNSGFFKFSPTKVHLYHLVRRAAEQGYDVFDHLRGEENYKSGWSNGFRHVNTMKAANDSVTSKFKGKLLNFRALLTPPRR